MKTPTLQMANSILYSTYFLVAVQLTQVLCGNNSANGEGLSIAGAVIHIPTGNSVQDVVQKGLSLAGATVHFPTENSSSENVIQRKNSSSENVILRSDYYIRNDYDSTRNAMQAAAIVYIVVGVLCTLSCCFGLCCICAKGRKETRGFILSNPNAGPTLAAAKPQQYVQDLPPPYDTYAASQQHQVAYTPGTSMQPQPAVLEFNNRVSMPSPNSNKY